VKTNCDDQVDFCPSRGPDAPFALGDIITKEEKPAAEVLLIKKRGAWGTHTRLAFLQINLSCTSGITSLVNWSVDCFDYKIIYGEFKGKLESGGRFGW
jgi:hypothetical protein